MNGSEGTAEAFEAVENIKRGREAIESELRKRIVGQEEVVELMLISLFARGHCLFMRSGSGKDPADLLIGRCARLSFKRIQFTPDLMPPDITGTEFQEDH